MSWGEDSCKRPCRAPNGTIDICNVDCKYYVWDGETEPNTTIGGSYEQGSLKRAIADNDSLCGDTITRIKSRNQRKRLRKKDRG